MTRRTQAEIKRAAYLMALTHRELRGLLAHYMRESDGASACAVEIELCRRAQRGAR